MSVDLEHRQLNLANEILKHNTSYWVAGSLPVVRNLPPSELASRRFSKRGYLGAGRDVVQAPVWHRKIWPRPSRTFVGICRRRKHNVINSVGVKSTRFVRRALARAVELSESRWHPHASVMKGTA